MKALAAIVVLSVGALWGLDWIETAKLSPTSVEVKIGLGAVVALFGLAMWSRSLRGK